MRLLFFSASSSPSASSSRSCDGARKMAAASSSFSGSRPDAGGSNNRPRLISSSSLSSSSSCSSSSSTSFRPSTPALFLIFLLSLPCDDWSCLRPLTLFASAAESVWSLSCDEKLYYGALNRSATLACRLDGVNLRENVKFFNIKWEKVRLA